MAGPPSPRILAAPLGLKLDRRDDGDLRERLREIARRHKRYGYRRALALLRRDRLKVNHKRVHRLWKQIGLQCPVRRKRKRSQHPGSVPQEATHPNHVWTYDFVFDTTSDSRTLKFLTLVDEFTRECQAIKVERRLPAKAVIAVLEQVFSERGMPEYLRSDNGPEFIAKAIQTWLKERQVTTRYIEPGSRPWHIGCAVACRIKRRQNSQRAGSLAPI